MTALHRSIYGSTGYEVNMPDLYRPSLDPSIFRPTPRDPNGFYYKPNRPMTPQSAITLECDQWRHDDGEERFESLLHISTDQTTVKGALVCRIQAENLSESAAKTIPIRISISRVSAFEQASALVDTLVNQPQFSFKQPPGKADSAQ